MTGPEAEPGRLRISRSCTIGLDELEWRFSASGGPGGQHANTANTRVEVVFPIATSPSLGPRQRARLMERIGPELRIVVSDERSQWRNRQLALERLRTRLAAGLHVEAVRHPTKPTVSSRQRRLSEKRAVGEKKRARRPVGPDD